MTAIIENIDGTETYKTWYEDKASGFVQPLLDNAIMYLNFCYSTLTAAIFAIL